MPMRTELAARLATRQRGYRDLARQLAEIGLVCPGRVVRRYTAAASRAAGVRRTPPEPDGPYWQYESGTNWGR